jgi:hypothetical protein
MLHANILATYGYLLTLKASASSAASISENDEHCLLLVCYGAGNEEVVVSYKKALQLHMQNR